jgi:tetratricopeptide (TPR) repeat protein
MAVPESPEKRWRLAAPGFFAVLAGMLGGTPGLAAPVAERLPSPASTTENAAPSATQLFHQGRAAYDAGNYPAAVAAFQQSYELSKKPELLFNIAQALRRNEQCDEALAYYQRYQNAASGELPSDLDDLRREAERCAGRQHARAQAESPRVPVTSAERSAPVTSSRPTPVRAALVTDVQNVRRPSSSRTRWLGASSVALGVAGTAVGVALAIDAARAADGTSYLSHAGGVWNDSAAANERAGKAYARWSIALFATSALAIGTGSWLLLRSEPTAASRIALVPQPGGAALDWCSTF